MPVSKKEKKAKKSQKQEKKVRKLQQKALDKLAKEGKVKRKCCEKYKKAEHKRCGKCPCFDLLKRVA
jgi:hypothetical protein